MSNNGVSNDNSPENQLDQYCSFSVTGAQESYQPIYVCYTCTNPNDGLCVCQACADACHAEHDGLEFIGMGAAYCDCRKLKGICCITEESDVKAASLGCNSKHPQVVHKDLKEGSYIRRAFRLPLLHDLASLTYVQRLALELVKHSRETFWIDDSLDSAKFCGLERLAWSIFQEHRQRFNLKDYKVGGAEWWVQVKPITYYKEGEGLKYNNGTEAVDLHFDKDEVLAESFGLGSFPTLSTVTYISGSSGAPPTLVCSRTYDEDDGISEVLISHPRRGKHLVFDGRLLHGAPSHFALRENIVVTEDEHADGKRQAYRITFLVNVWLGHKPVGVLPLPSKIQDALEQVPLPAFFAANVSKLEFDECSIAEIDISERDLEGDSEIVRIELPFLGKETTWGEGDDDSQVVLSMYVPQRSEKDTTLYRFAPQLCAEVCSPANEKL